MGQPSGWAITSASLKDTGDRSEFSQHIRDHHVLDLELGRGVNAIDRLGTGARFGLNHDKPRLEFGRFVIACGAPVCVLMAVTWAPGTPAREASVTVPEIDR